MKVLLTGFEGFNQSKVNPSAEIVKRIKEREGVEFIREILPVEFKKAAKRIKELMAAHTPDLVLCLGQAGNRSEIAIERIAINLDCVRSSNGTTELPDNGGDRPIDRKIEQEGENAYFSNLPVWEMVEALQYADIPAAVSYSAGTYVCNHVMYTVLYEINSKYPGVKGGFVHVPFLPVQAEERKEGKIVFSMELDMMVEGIETILTAILEEEREEYEADQEVLEQLMGFYC